MYFAISRDDFRKLQHDVVTLLSFMLVNYAKSRTGFLIALKVNIIIIIVIVVKIFYFICEFTIQVYEYIGQRVTSEK